MPAPDDDYGHRRTTLDQKMRGGRRPHEVQSAVLCMAGPDKIASDAAFRVWPGVGRGVPGVR